MNLNNLINRNKMKEIEISLIDSVTDDNLSNALANIGEAVLDSMLESGIIQNIPIIDTIYRSGKIIVSIRDQFFAKKILSFLQEIKTISVDDRKKFIEELENETQQKAGETLVVLLDRLDNLEKPIVLANLFKAKVQGYITIESFLRLSFIVDRGYLPDLKKLKDFVDSNYSYKENVTEILFSLGLLYPTPITVIQDSLDDNPREINNSLNDYSVSNIGLDLLKYGLQVN